MVALKRAEMFDMFNFRDNLLRAGVFGDGFGAFTDSVLGKFSRKEEPDSGLDLPRCDGGSLVVVSQTRSFGSDAFENVVDEAVHDAHGFAGHTSIWMYLLQNLVDIDSVRFLALAVPLLLVTLADVFGGFARFLDGLSASFRCHCDCFLSR